MNRIGNMTDSHSVDEQRSRRQHRLLTSRSHNIILRDKRTNFVNSEVANRLSQLIRVDCRAPNSAYEIFWVLRFLSLTFTLLKYAGIFSKNKFVSRHSDVPYILNMKVYKSYLCEKSPILFGIPIF